MIESPAHLALARRPRRRSIVLLENRGGVLPLAADGASAGGDGADRRELPVLLANYHGIPTRPVKLLGGIAARRTPAVSASTTSRRAAHRDAPGAIADAVAAARDGDATVAVVGLDPRLEGEEGGNRFNRPATADLELPPRSASCVEAVFATGKPVIVVLTGGSALAMPWLAARAAAVLYAWYPGAEGGHAVADVLFGDVNPAGRLPITIYRSTDDLPPFADYAMRGRTYRYFEGEPLYAFGYGLSYRRSATRRSAPSPARTPAAAVELENTGSRAGDEVVQLYIIPRNAPAYAPRRWLAGFSRVTLEPGERRIVKLPFGSQRADLRRRGGRPAPARRRGQRRDRRPPARSRRPLPERHQGAPRRCASVARARAKRGCADGKVRKRRPDRRRVASSSRVEGLAEAGGGRPQLVGALRIQIVGGDDENRDVGHARRLRAATPAARGRRGGGSMMSSRITSGPGGLPRRR